MSQARVKSKVILLRRLRRLHRWLGIPLMLFFLVIGVTSVLLAWKKKMELLPATQKSELLSDQKEWISPVQMIEIAKSEMMKKGESTEVDRIDIRPDKGIAKVTFKTHFSEVQLDGFSGEVLSVETRHSDWIEKVHDGSIVDYYFWQSETAKLTYSSATAFGLILMSISGFYLWYFPKRIRKLKQS
ncbi:PepSY-associated TM helix domain-containing protein [Algoriphagus sediminis]|uniref:PepSY-associated TM helix domain-containing protein n=1 Tax=Algoriphagus sediminis TaxID=3057113 RepID=A0ABT7YAA7_9BACT|nr:PepSY-associated TM helix domain-containing protein [Algoriphagus sediminis]MDN3203438.1 PepSY-associated TM helix domain-containing protein [Algoriphagus sediminis]